MRILVMSDSHGDLETVKTVSSQSGDAIFHCGDSELLFNDAIFGDMYKVRGNCDIDSSFPNEVLANVKGKTILAVHGHEHNVNQSLMSLQYSAMEKHANIVLFGHTHLYGAEIIDGILFVNPGSTKQPRGGKKPTYAVVEWDETIRVTFKNMGREVVDSIEIKNV
ncbi:metallophosphoesterase [Sporosarcina sp. G11-34]|uniref:metallophosphoesterase n=1 Tax=Sporosarcina sp. G11-34 TaxID=2849605 RepID=UPI0022A9EB4E|nr:metallophosphoesterase [Sporosarcina sp. G11-34]MCZ2258065.1 metallophosphoesterase [Sporosarcina sp. G11-34]